MNIIEPKWSWDSGLSKRAFTKYIALHHAEASSCSVYDVDAWHKQNGWSGIGYHFFVRKNGEVYRGRPLDSLGAHVQGMNNCSLGICAEGSYMKETMPIAQKKAIAELIDYLKTNFYPDAQIVGHREIGSSDCPGTNFPLDELKNYKSLLDGSNSEKPTNTTASNSESKEAKTLIDSSTGGVAVKDSFKAVNGELHHALLVDGIDVTKYAGGLTWSNSVEELSTSLSFEIAKTDMRYMNLATPKLGGIVSLFANTEIFRGIIVSVDDGNEFSNTYNAFDFGWYLNKSKETYQFNNVSANDAITKICNDFNVDIFALPELNKNITQIYIDKTISEIIDDILEQCDKVYTYDVIPAGLRIYELGSLYAYPEFRITPNTQLLFSPNLHGNVTHSISIEEMKNSVKVVSNKDNVYTVQKVLRDDNSVYEYGLLQEVITIDPEKDSVDIVAENSFSSLNKPAETFQIQIIEQVESYTMAGYRITVGDNDYVIMNTEHIIENGIHYVTLELKRYSADLLKKQQSSALPQKDSVSQSDNGARESSVIEKAVSWAVGIANDNSHGYDQNSRWGPDYDCSSLVISAFEQAGVKVKTGGATYTGNMKSVFLKYGFSDVTGSINLSSGSGLKRGDVLLNTVHHTALVVTDGGGTIVNASINEKGKTAGGKKGDQTGKEIYTRGYYNYPWNVVLRYNG